MFAHSGTLRLGTLRYPSHAISPQVFLTFVELDEFFDEWKALGLSYEDDLYALQVAIMANPDGPPVVEGTGGLRKTRFAPSSWKTGKSGGVRVCYVYFEEHALVLLCMAYDHRQKDNLSAEEKRGIKEYIAASREWLSNRRYY